MLLVRTVATHEIQTQEELRKYEMRFEPHKNARAESALGHATATKASRSIQSVAAEGDGRALSCGN
jgi:hypothetical protein